MFTTDRKPTVTAFYQVARVATFGVTNVATDNFSVAFRAMWARFFGSWDMLKSDVSQYHLHLMFNLPQSFFDG